MASTGRIRLLAITLGILSLLVFGCSFAGYRYLDSIDWFLPRVDARELQARAQREQPVGGGEAETVTFLRSLGFEDRHILIERGSASSAFPGRLFSIQGWIPQPQCCLQPRQIRALCIFDNTGRLTSCNISGRGSPLAPSTSGSFVQTTPAPAR
jgi:hypothetical protein